MVVVVTQTQHAEVTQRKELDGTRRNAEAEDGPRQPSAASRGEIGEAQAAFMGGLAVEGAPLRSETAPFKSTHRTRMHQPVGRSPLVRSLDPGAPLRRSVDLSLGSRPGSVGVLMV